MSGTTVRKSSNTLIYQVLSQANLYDYGMLVKLLKNYFGIFARVSTKPALNLSFNANDVQNILIYDLEKPLANIYQRSIHYEKLQPEEAIDLYAEAQAQNTISKYRIHIIIFVNFFGLYGSSTPLPIYISEELIKDEAEDNYSTVDFLSMLNEPIYKQYKIAAKKYRLFSRLVEDRDEWLIERLFAFAGLAIQDIRNANLNMYDVLPYLGAFSMIPRNREGLKTILRGEFHDKVSLEEFVAADYEIPKSQWMSLGENNSTLGSDAYLGTKIKTTINMIVIHIQCNSFDEYKSLLPNQPKYNKLSGILSLYMMDRIDIQLDLELINEEQNFVYVGDQSLLGYDSYIYGNIQDHKMHFKYMLQY